MSDHRYAVYVDAIDARGGSESALYATTNTRKRCERLIRAAVRDYWRDMSTSWRVVEAYAVDRASGRRLDA